MDGNSWCGLQLAGKQYGYEWNHCSGSARTYLDHVDSPVLEL